MNELDHDQRRLLSAARAALGPSAADRARLRARLGAAIAAGRSPPTDDASEPPAPLGAAPGLGDGWFGSVTRAAAPWLAGGLLLGVGFGGGYVAGRRSASPPVPASLASPAAPVATAPAPVTQGAADPTPAAHGAPAPSAPAPGQPTAPRAAPAGVPSDALAAEVALLQQAQRALKQGDPASATRIVGEVDLEFPHGVLREERDAARVLARCASEPGEATRSLAQDFERTFPASVYVDRVRAGCAASTRAVEERAADKIDVLE